MFDFLYSNTHISGILLAYSVLAVAVLSPGPAVLAIIGTSMERGRKAGACLTLGVICGSALWGTAAALGISAILVTYANVLVIIKILGGMYLLWLAYKSLRSAMSKDQSITELTTKTGTSFQMWRTGFIIHLTNPKAIIGWISMIALGVTPQSPAWVSFVIVVGGVTLSFIGHMGYAFIFSTKSMSSLYLKAKRPIAFILSVFFGFAGIKLLTSRVQ